MTSRITVRFDQQTIDLITNISHKRGEQVSNFIRRSVKSELGKLGFLDEEDLKALGVHT